MNIELTKEEYKTLLKIMYCGEWIMNSHKKKKDALSKETDKLEQVIFSRAKEFKMDKWIEFDEESKMYFPTQSMEENCHVHIDRYDNRTRERF